MENTQIKTKKNSPGTAEKAGQEESPTCCSHDHPGIESKAKKEERPRNLFLTSVKAYLPAILSLLLLVSGLVMDQLEKVFFTGILRFAWYTAAYIPVAYNVLRQAYFKIRKGDVFNEFFLMGIATLGAFYIGEYAEGVAVMLFYVVGELFQEAAVLRSRRSIRELLDNRPENVTLSVNGSLSSVHPESVRIGDIIQVKAGEKVALDGQLISARSSFNTAALTGESRPDSKVKGDQVLAGMINLDRVIEIRTTAVYEDSALSRILKLVERATSRKAKTQLFISRFAKVYTPVVVFLALGVTFLPYLFVEEYVFNEWLYKALIFLVLSCPCALVVSIPLGYFGGIGAASRKGILFKGSVFLDEITRVDTVVLDKTGTLTRGVFKVREVRPSGVSETFLLSRLAALESRSSHPVATAITAYAGTDASKINVSEVTEIPGHGLQGVIERQTVLAGNTRLLTRFGIAYPSDLDGGAETIVAVAIDGSYAGSITIADEIRPDALSAITGLRKMGIKDIVLLSGDKPQVVEAVAKRLGITNYAGGLLPEDKVNKVEELRQQGRKVAFLGDGINDAPVITLADVGLAMGAMGSDAAIETADVVIQNDQPSRLITAMQIGKATRRVVWQNIGLAFIVKAAVLLMGAGGIATMWEAVFADVGVAFLAILNAVRIGRSDF